jgi:hypothetical protein
VDNILGFLIDVKYSNGEYVAQLVLIVFGSVGHERKEKVIDILDLASLYPVIIEIMGTGYKMI